MTYIFKYHPDNTIYRNGNYDCSFEQFKLSHPTFPLAEGQFLEWDGKELELIELQAKNTYGHKKIEDLDPYADLIKAINNLGE